MSQAKHERVFTMSKAYSDITVQVFICIDIPQNSENIYCLLFIGLTVAVFQPMLLYVNS